MNDDPNSEDAVPDAQGVHSARSRLAERTGLVGLLVVQAVVGYEWLMSGVTKVWRGGFASGLAAELSTKSTGVTGWYRTLLDDAIIPNAEVVGWLVLIGEIVVGIVLIGGALVWIFRGDQLSSRVWQLVLGIMGLASLAAIVMAVNFHLANASPHPWLIPQDGFDEGVDLDSVLPAVEMVMVLVTGRLLLAERRTRRINSRADGAIVTNPDTVPIA